MVKVAPAGAGTTGWKIGMLETTLGDAPGIAAVTVICTLAIAEWPAVSDAVTVKLCVPISREAGVHEKLPDEFMFDFEILVPLKASETENIGFENPYASAENVTADPTGIDASGTGAVRIMVAGTPEADVDAEVELPVLPPTVIVRLPLALLPSESETFTVILCEPASFPAGVQLKFPEEFIFDEETVLPPKESLKVYEVVLAKPTGTALNFKFWPGSMEVPGVIPEIETLAIKLTFMS